MTNKVFITTIICLFFAEYALSQLPCKDSFPASMFQNASFEEYGECNPYWRGEGGLIDGSSTAVLISVPYWHAVNVNQSPRYYNYNCHLTGLSIFDNGYLNSNRGYPGIPQPLPDGKGLVSIEQYNQYEAGAGIPENKTKKVYITSCLANNLKAGTTYYFDFQFGFSLFNPNFNNVTGVWASPSPFSVGIFGRKDCPSFPLNITPDASLGCLGDSPGWISLGKTELRGRNQWVEGFIEFTPSENISAVAIGPSCDYNANIADTFALYYMDKFILAPKKDFAFKTISLLRGDVCNGNFVLQAPGYSNASYQWYKDDLAIDGATLQTYIVPDNAAGYYMAKISLPGWCFNSVPYPIHFSPIRNFTLLTDTVTCLPNTIMLNAKWPGAQQYLWQDGDTNAIFTAFNSGTYSVRVTDGDGCVQNKSAHVNIENCDSCAIYFPKAFTPNNDGINDLFKPLNMCSGVNFAQYHIIIFNRFGQSVFESNDPHAGWTGTLNNRGAPEGVYVYTLQYNFMQKLPVQLKGTVMLLR